MMIRAKSIELFKNIAQYDYENQYYDFHNDYSCKNLYYSDNALSIAFQSLINDTSLSLKFIDAKITIFNFFNVKEVRFLTIDNLYRGRFDFKGELIEVSEDDNGYFYLEFYEGQKLEFWAKGLCIQKE